MSRRVLPLLALLGLIGCATPGKRLLGSELAASPVVVASLKSATAPFSLSGTMVEKCPTAGCWLRLKDATGIVKVDLKAAGFTVTDVPKNAAIQVFGRYDKKTGEVEATGLRW